MQRVKIDTSILEVLSTLNNWVVCKECNLWTPPEHLSPYSSTIICYACRWNPKISLIETYFPALLKEFHKNKMRTLKDFRSLIYFED